MAAGVGSGAAGNAGVAEAQMKRPDFPEPGIILRSFAHKDILRDEVCLAANRQVRDACRVGSGVAGSYVTVASVTREQVNEVLRIWDIYEFVEESFSG